MENSKVENEVQTLPNPSRFFIQRLDSLILRKKPQLKIPEIRKFLLRIKNHDLKKIHFGISEIEGKPIVMDEPVKPLKKKHGLFKWLSKTYQKLSFK